MSAMSDYLEAELLKHIFRTGSFTKPTKLCIALCKSVPVDADTGALTNKEIDNAGQYAREQLNPLDANWTAVGTNGLTDNAVEIAFEEATTEWGWVSGVAICDHEGYGSGNMLLYGSLTTPRKVEIGDVFRFAIGRLDVTFA